MRVYDLVSYNQIYPFLLQFQFLVHGQIPHTHHYNHHFFSLVRHHGDIQVPISIHPSINSFINSLTHTHIHTQYQSGKSSIMIDVSPLVQIPLASFLKAHGLDLQFIPLTIINHHWISSFCVCLSVCLSVLPLSIKGAHVASIRSLASYGYVQERNQDPPLQNFEYVFALFQPFPFDFHDRSLFNYNFNYILY